MNCLFGSCYPLVGYWLVTLCRYYEGQLTPISEIDVEDDVRDPQISVAEAAEKVRRELSMSFPLCLSHYFQNKCSAYQFALQFYTFSASPYYLLHLNSVESVCCCLSCTSGSYIIILW